MAPHALVLRHSPSPGRPSPGASTQTRSSVTGSGNTAPPISSGTEAVGLAPERAQLLAMGLSEPVVHTLQSARAPSTRTLYSYRWRVFSSWCTSRHFDPMTCSIPDILEFLQEHLDSGKSPTTLRGFVAAISAARGSRLSLSPHDGRLLGQFLKGAQRLKARRSESLPPWDLDTVLRALVLAPFEPLDLVDLKWLSLKTAFLIASHFS